jgi:putative hydrolase of the HAD superfamily
MAKLKGVIAFDLDDTLYKERDFVRSGWMAVAKHIAELNQGHVTANELFDVMQNAGNAFDALSAYLSDRNGLIAIDIDQMLAIYRNHFPSISLDKLTRYTLDRIKAEGYAIALITDGRATTQRNKIAALGLDKYAANEAIIISEEIGNDKNTPAPFELLRSRLGDVSYTYVGDNPAKDFHYPNLMGWKTLMLKDTQGVNIHTQSTTDLAPEFRAQATIDSLDQILDSLLIK